MLIRNQIRKPQNPILIGNNITVSYLRVFSSNNFITKYNKDNRSYSLNKIERIFEKSRAKNQNRTWLRRNKQRFERKSGYINSIKKIRDLEINFSKKENEKLQDYCH